MAVYVLDSHSYISTKINHIYIPIHTYTYLYIPVIIYLYINYIITQIINTSLYCSHPLLLIMNKE